MITNIERGVTLIELIVVITIIAIIASLATPSLQHWLRQLEAQRIRHSIVSALTQAKTESYITHQSVLLCLSNGLGRCHRDASEQLLLFVDKNNNKHFDKGIDRLILQDTLAPKYALLHLRVSSKRHHSKFWGDTGLPIGHIGHIEYCPTSHESELTYQISFNKSGIIKFKPNKVHPTGCP